MGEGPVSVVPPGPKLALNGPELTATTTPRLSSQPHKQVSQINQKHLQPLIKKGLSINTPGQRQNHTTAHYRYSTLLLLGYLLPSSLNVNTSCELWHPHTVHYHSLPGCRWPQTPGVIFNNSSHCRLHKEHTLLTVNSTQTHTLLVQLVCLPRTIYVSQTRYTLYVLQTAKRYQKNRQLTKRTNQITGSELWAAIGCPLWWRHLVNTYGVKAWCGWLGQWCVRWLLNTGPTVS